MNFELLYGFPSGEGLGVCDKRPLIHSDKRCAALPLMKGGRGMLTPKGVSHIVHRG